MKFENIVEQTKYDSLLKLHEMHMETDPLSMVPHFHLLLASELIELLLDQNKKLTEKIEKLSSKEIMLYEKV